jgi:hypothetical protein
MKNRIVVKYLLFALAGTTLLSCNSDKEPFVQRHYYNNGKLKEEIEMSKDSVPHGNWKQYFESGVLKSRFSYVDGIKNGTAELYYPSGNLLEAGTYHDKKRVGKVLFYGDFPGRPIVAETNYVIVRGKEFPNNVIEYDTAGNIIRRTPQIVMDQKKDSLLITMTYPELRYMNVVTGDFDSLYALRDERSLDTVQSVKNYSVSIPLKEKYNTGDVIRGVVQNYEVGNTSKAKGHPKKVRLYYFNYRIKSL